MGLYRLNKNDVDIAIEVSKVFKSTTPKEEKVQSFLSDSKNYLMIYKDDNKVVGFAYGFELQRFDGKNSMMYIHEIGVLPEYRRQGIGKAIINELIEICKEKDFMKMFLITMESNIPAVTLYERTGGKVNAKDYIVYDYEMQY